MGYPGPASGEYAVAARIDDSRRGNGHIVAWAPGTVVVTDTHPPPAPALKGVQPLDDAMIVTWWADTKTPRPGRLQRGVHHSRLVAEPAGAATGAQPDTESGHRWRIAGACASGRLLNGFTSDICVGPTMPVTTSARALPFRSGFRRIRHASLSERSAAASRADGIAAPGARAHRLLDAAERRRTPGLFPHDQPAGCMIPEAKSVAAQWKSPIDVGQLLPTSLPA